jgi:sugar phosphate isomerase/epimerase
VKIGYNTWSMASVPYDTFIPALADIGFRAIAISVVPGYTIGGLWVPNACALDTLSREDRRRIKQAFYERELQLPSVIGNQPLLGQDATDQLDRLRRTVDACVELMPPNQPAPTMNTGVGGHTGELELKGQMVVERLGELAEYAERRGVVICIEPHVGGAIDTIERAEWLVRTVNSPHVLLDFDVSHFEVVGVPMDQSVGRLAPLAGAAEIKDQKFRFADDGARDGWLVPGNGTGQAFTSDGEPVEYQFLLAGEGSFDLPRYVQLMHAHRFTAPIAFEASVQCQARPGYDAIASAAGIYQWMLDGWRAAGVPCD